MSKKDPFTGHVAYGIKQAAQALCVSEGLVRKHLSEIPCMRLGERVLIPVEPLKHWLAEQAKAQQNEAERVSQQILDALKAGSDEM